MADLLEADAEAAAEHVDVVALLPRRLEEGRVGHEHRAGEVVRQRDARERAGLVGRRECASRDDAIDARVTGSRSADLVGELEVRGCAAGAPRRGAGALLGIEAAHHPALGPTARDAHLDAVTASR